jgi:hypothetical protein
MFHPSIPLYINELFSNCCPYQDSVHVFDIKNWGKGAELVDQIHIYGVLRIYSGRTDTISEERTKLELIPIRRQLDGV